MTNLKYLTDHLNLRVRLFPQWEEQFKLRVNELTIRKGAQLLHPGEYCQSLYFVKSGFFRVFESDGFEERTIYFTNNGQFLTSAKSFLYQTISNKGIVCEQEGTVFSISFKQLLELENLSIDFIVLAKILLTEHVFLLKEENELFRVANTEAKYRYLIKRYPGIGNIISQKNIASYLGVTATTISNILKATRKGLNGKY